MQRWFQPRSEIETSGGHLVSQGIPSSSDYLIVLAGEGTTSFQIPPEQIQLVSHRLLDLLIETLPQTSVIELMKDMVQLLKDHQKYGQSQSSLVTTRTVKAHIVGTQTRPFPAWDDDEY